MGNLNLYAPVGKTGYGVAGYNILNALKERDWDVSLFMHGNNVERNDPKELSVIKEALEQAVLFDNDAPCLNIWHQFDLSHRIGQGKYVAFPFFELDTFNEREKHHLGCPDKLCGTSEWAVKVLESQVPNRGDVYTVPLGIDTSIFNPNYSRKENENTVFLNCGKWEIRKGHDFLINLFHEAFTVDDKVELWMLPHNPFLTMEDIAGWENMYLDTPMGRAGKVKIFGWQKDHSDVANVMAGADCGIFPSRAEGWNLELLEMMAMGKQIIATNYSAHTEFCNTDNSMLVDIDGLELAFDGKWFFEQGNWAEIEDAQLEKIVEYLQIVHEKCQRPGLFVNDPGIETGREYTWDNTAKKLEIVLDISQN